MKETKKKKGNEIKDTMTQGRTRSKRKEGMKWQHEGDTGNKE